MSFRYLSLKLSAKKNNGLLLMAYGPINQEDFLLLLQQITGGVGIKNPNHVVFTPVDVRTLYSNGHTCRTTDYSEET